MTTRPCDEASEVLYLVQDPDEDETMRVMLEFPHEAYDTNSVVVIEKTGKTVYSGNTYPKWKIIEEEEPMLNTS